MLRDLRYLFAYTLPISAFVAVSLGGYWSYLTVFYAFGIIPILDTVAPQARTNVDGEESPHRLANRLFDWLLYLNLPLFYLLTVYTLHTLAADTLATYEVVGCILSVGIIAGTLGINVAHELGHRASTAERVLAQALLIPCLYTHFYVEHNRGHHKHVGTPRDPATSRFGESLYAFWLRSVWGSYSHAWALEADRLRRAGKSSWSLSNQMIHFTLLQVLYLGLVYATWGAAAVGYAIAIAVTGFLLLESVNYIEHYGLVRQQLANGRYEAVSPLHSWNSEHEIGRIVLYELTRHADHHYKSTRKYQQLRYIEESPELPAGYPASILMALVPPLWFGVMNERVPQLAPAV